MPPDEPDATQWGARNAEDGGTSYEPDAGSLPEPEPNYESLPTRDRLAGADHQCEGSEVRACTCPDGVDSLAGCWPDGDFGDCRCPSGDETAELRELRSQLVGSWSGTRWTPWRGEEGVWIGFAFEGTYECEGPEGSTFYWGFDELEPKHWRIDDVTPEGLGLGQLEVRFETGSQYGAVEDLELTADGHWVTFKFFDTWADHPVNPVEFVLERDEASE